ncbi:uncharacterized protein LOC110701645 [Chenopodium quinoa]|uniref:uncharacterized protein LOC110701645 n=1 Tax=Chenopodium quinoa TaxID=63459 RepID=UPI000B78FDAD|nr:uncharacterized protein LOC110701645 [Chenopodium quinoa]
MMNRNCDYSKWCDFHKDHGHTLDECTHLKDNIEDLVRRGYLNQFRHHLVSSWQREEDRSGHDRRGSYKGPTEGKDRDSKPENRVYVINGGLPRATFEGYDQKGIIYPHNNPLVVTVSITNWEVDRVLIDSGSSSNIIYISAFKEMQLDKRDLKRVSYEVTGFNGSGLVPEGIIELSVRVGERSRQCDVQAEFLVIDSPSLYNVIVGRPLIHKIGGVVSIYQFAMMYTTNDERSAKLS